MKLKEAIKILQDFRAVAGEDAICDLGELQLVSRVDVKYESYGYSREVEKSQGIAYTVKARREADAMPGPHPLSTT